jgi:hypothetical protein
LESAENSSTSQQLRDERQSEEQQGKQQQVTIVSSFWGFENEREVNLCNNGCDDTGIAIVFLDN